MPIAPLTLFGDYVLFIYENWCQCSSKSNKHKNIENTFFGILSANPQVDGRYTRIRIRTKMFGIHNTAAMHCKKRGWGRVESTNQRPSTEHLYRPRGLWPDTDIRLHTNVQIAFKRHKKTFGTQSFYRETHTYLWGAWCEKRCFLHVHGPIFKGKMRKGSASREIESRSWLLLFKYWTGRPDHRVPTP
jgi:hypothetical protein